MKSFQMPKHCKAVYNTLRHDFTTMTAATVLSFVDDHKINSRNIAVKFS